MTALADHLFWDVERSGIDPERHAAWLAQRVLEYGRWADWQLLVAHYSKPRLAELVNRPAESPAPAIRILLRLVSTPAILLPMLRFDAIPESVRKLLACLPSHEALRGFALGGGTSLALRFGHH